MKSKIFGILILMESFFMMLSSGVSLYYHYHSNDCDFKSLLYSTIITFTVGCLLFLNGKRSKQTKLTRKDSFLIVSLVWVIFSFLGMLPFLFYGTTSTVEDAFFETMSGFTTTGASVLNNINEQPHGILFWRSIMQWLGGLGIVVFSFALIPVYELKNTQIFSAEVTGLDVDKLRPKIGDTARRLLIIYILITALCTLSFWLGPMNLYDSVCHAMTTIATGGYSTHQNSLAYFNSPYIEYMCSFFMFISGINFSLYYYLSIGKSKAFCKNEEMRWYTCFTLAAVAVFVCLFYYVRYQMSASSEQLALLPEGFETTFRTSLFHVVTLLTSTGFQASNFDYVGWGQVFWMPTLIILFMGACAGSTGGGFKVIRMLVCLKDSRNEFKRQLHPRAVIPVRLSGYVLSESKVLRALAFLFLYLVIMVISVCLLTMMGLTMDTAIGSCITSLSNAGPGLGTTGPASNFYEVPVLGKWLLSFLMLVGRLEIFTVLFLFIPDFWKEKS